jgi:hypothetical protein
MEHADVINYFNKELSLEIPLHSSYRQLQALLSSHINDLIKNDFEKLIAYLYRIDVSEQKLKTLLKQFPEEDAGNIIASLVLERQEQKLKTRKQYSKREDDFDSEEKW